MTTTTTRNEAAERLLRVAENLRRRFNNPDLEGGPRLEELLNEALAAERRATVERIRTAWNASWPEAAKSDSAGWWTRLVHAILGAEEVR